MGFFSSKSKKDKSVTSSEPKKGMDGDEIAVVMTTTTPYDNTTKPPSFERNDVIDSSKTDPLLVEKTDSDDNEMVVIVDKSTSVEGGDPNLTNVESGITTEGEFAPSISYSTYGDGSALDQDVAHSIMKVGPLTNPEPMVNGQLIQWKFAAEEGPWPLRLMTVTAAVFTAVTSILPYCLDYRIINTGDAIVSGLSLLASFLVVFLDGRFSCVRDPVGCRATVRNHIVKNIGSLKLVWGRGVLCLIIGLLQVALTNFYSYISGATMIVVGFIALIVGRSASNNLSRLRSSLTDDEYLWNEFTKHDYDNDGFLSPTDFANFVWALGLEFGDVYTLKAFNAIDKDRDLKISFQDFQLWWSQCTDGGDGQLPDNRSRKSKFRVPTPSHRSSKSTGGKKQPFSPKKELETA